MKRFVAIAAVALAAFVGGPWVYINVIRDDAPARLRLTTAPTSSSDSTQIKSADGRWTIGPNSLVGYRVKEILFGQDTEGVGRTSDIQGSLVVEASALTSAEFTVDMTTLQSDDGRRDGQFRGRIMDTATYPTATFVLSDQIALPSGSLSGSTVTVTARGTLTLRGQTKDVQIPIEARVTADTIEVVGSINIVFAEWGIPNPSRPGISTADNGDLEFQLTFVKS